jgi:hypothetical protein
MGTSLVPFFTALGESSWSTAIHESEIAYSIIESIHVWSLALFFGLAVVFDLRLLDLSWRKVPVSEFANRLLPWTILGFVLLVVTGILLVYAIPLRTYQSLFFRFKMVLLVLAGINVWIFHSRVYPSVAKWDVGVDTPRAAKIAGAFSLILWVGVVFSGRMIAYNWFDCDRQPQADIVNFLTACVPSQSEN